MAKKKSWSKLFDHDLRLYVVSLTALFVLCVLGCGKQQIDRKPIHGKIIGAEGRNGVVTFIPVNASIGPAVTKSFKEGAYQFSKSDGPVPGDYKVNIKFAVSDSKPAQPKKEGGARAGRGGRAMAGGRVAYDETMTTKAAVPADGPFEIDLNPTEPSSE